MTDVFIQGFGLCSCLGMDLVEAVKTNLAPPQPQRRAVNGLDHPLPYLPINTTDAASALEDSECWWQRCETLVRSALVQAGCCDTSAILFLASSTANVGAVAVADDPHSEMQGFLDRFKTMLQWQGPVVWINTACTSSLNALLQAQQSIVAGNAESAVVLGFELENKLCIAGFAGMQLLDADRAKPLAKDRAGLVLGEAVAAIRLAKTPSRWRLLGGAQVVDSSQLSGASESAYTQMLQQVFTQTQLSPQQFALIKLQAAGSPSNDAVEAQALHANFDPLPALISLKSLLGHTLGASGAAEIALLLALLEGNRWPNVRLPAEALDSDLGINFASAAPVSIQNLLLCNLGFGGSHACVALQQEAVHA